MAEHIALHIEDDDASAYLLRAALEQVDCSVAVFRVTDGEAALSFLRRTGKYVEAPRPDLVIVDLNLPRVSGFEVLEYVQADEKLRSIPTVVLTTSTAEVDRRRAERLGTRSYISKPSDYSELLEQVQGICHEFLPPHQPEPVE